MVTIYIDGKSYEVDENQNLLHVCLSLGLNLEYFCWHPALGSVGACRQCAVKQYKDLDDDEGQIVMACMTAAKQGIRISINDAEAKRFRAQIIEWLMINHPHDCPICDEGGECHLQDMTIMSGHNYRRFRFNKRTYRNQYLGPLINHEMNRCIQCYRCVRFYREYAGGRDLDVFGAHDHVYFGRYEDGALESEFSGNLVEVCPTGVFTDKTLKKHYTRKWDLTTAPSICVHCSLGCNTISGERYGELRRIYNRYHHQINGYFLCDRGRYGYEFVNESKRLRYPLQQTSQGSEILSGERALEWMKEKIDFDKVIGLGSPRASLEANFALRELVGSEHFYAGISERDNRLNQAVIRILRKGPTPTPSMHDVKQADAVLVLGEDLTNTAPMLDLAVRQAVRNRPISEIPETAQIPKWQDDAVREAVQEDMGPLYIATPVKTKLDEIATQTYRASPDEISRLGFAIAHHLDSTAPSVSGLSDETLNLVDQIAQALKSANHPVVVSGTSLKNEKIVQAAANIAWALHGYKDTTRLCFVLPECNSIGLSLFEADGLESAHQALQENHIDSLVILENDLYRRADAALVDDLIAVANKVVVLDHLENSTTLRADLVLPAATFAEGDGTLVNNEGRAQRYYQVFVPNDEVKESWRWLGEMLNLVNQGRAWKIVDEVVSALEESLSTFASLSKAALSGDFRSVGQKIPRQSHRYSGRTAIQAHKNVSEPKPPDDPDSPFSFSMEGFKGQPPPALIPRYWSPGWNSVQALNKFQEEISGPLRGDDPGLRLIEPPQIAEFDYFQDIPMAFDMRESSWYVVPLYHIFGSEEMSVNSKGIMELIPDIYIALNPQDAKQFGIDSGELVLLTLDEAQFTLPIQLVSGIPSGVAGLLTGLPKLPFAAVPAWGKIDRMA